MIDFITSDIVKQAEVIKKVPPKTINIALISKKDDASLLPEVNAMPINENASKSPEIVENSNFLFIRKF